MGRGLHNYSRSGAFHRLAPGLAGGGGGLWCVGGLTLCGSFILTRIHDLAILQFVIGVFLLLFGLRWLGKAVARGVG